MKIYTIYFIICAGAILFFNSCKTEEQTVFPIESTIHVIQRENLDTTFVDTETQETYRAKDYIITFVASDPKDCEGNVIEGEYLFAEAEKKVQIKLNVIKKTQSCPSGSIGSYPYYNVNVSQLQSGNSYFLSIQIGDKEAQTGVIEVTDTTYTILMNKGIGMAFPNPILRRIPEKIIWGQLISRKSISNFESTVKTLYAPFSSLGLDSVNISPGNYYYFFVLTDKSVFVDPFNYYNYGTGTFEYLSFTEYYQYSFFIRKINGNQTKIKEHFRLFKNNNILLFESMWAVDSKGGDYF
ncbi:MAG: hypothetical protein QM536_09590 [Chitinophagaceae bacterium]|nr:hypothetical protein [Chitinophagaceae bacterium]